MDEDVADSLKKRDTTAHDRRLIFYGCRAAMVDGVVKRGFISELAQQLGFERKTVSRHWNNMQRVLAPLLNNQDEENHHAIIQQNAHILFGTGHSSRRKGKYKYDRDELAEAVKRVPLKQRQTIRNLSSAAGVPHATIQRFLKPRQPKVTEESLDVAIFKRHTSKLKPTLTELNKLSRFHFALEQINPVTMNLRTPKFFAQFNKVHIDEKWFHLSQDGERYILAEGEVPPKRHVKHKNFILKVMFLCAQAHPRWDHTTNTMWDGKLGIWPIGSYVLAQRNSVNRAAGTTEWRNETVDKERYKDFLINNVIQAVIDKWPMAEFADPNFQILIQQDGAGGHCSHNDDDLLDYLESIHLDHKISFYTQPPNSPDLNILDLGLFAALQAQYYKTAPTTQVQLIEMVEKTYNEFDYKKINRIWVTLQTIFNKIIEHHGDNDYKIPHMNKQKLERENRLPIALEVSADALRESDGHL
jgi:hypothetical protein